MGPEVGILTQAGERRTLVTRKRRTPKRGQESSSRPPKTQTARATVPYRLLMLTILRLTMKIVSPPGIILLLHRASKMSTLLRWSQREFINLPQTQLHLLNFSQQDSKTMFLYTMFLPHRLLSQPQPILLKPHPPTKVPRSMILQQKQQISVARTPLQLTIKLVTTPLQRLPVVPPVKLLGEIANRKRVTLTSAVSAGAFGGDE